MPNQYTSKGRTVAFSMRFTEGEWKDLETRAKASGRPVVDVIRDALGFRAPEQVRGPYASLAHREDDREG